jgi:hypothetical protein
MPRGLARLSLLLFVASVVAAPVPKAKPVEPYFPTAVGTRWVYERESGELLTEEITDVTVKDGERRVTIRTTQNGHHSDEKYTVIEKQVVKCTTGQFKLDLRVLQLPLKEKDTWEFEIPIQQGLKCDAGTMTVGKAVKVEVPAGTFEAVPVVSETTAVDGKAIPTPEKCTRWYAAGVGMVKIEYASGHRVLKEFNPAKK